MKLFFGNFLKTLITFLSIILFLGLNRSLAGGGGADVGGGNRYERAFQAMILQSYLGLKNIMQIAEDQTQISKMNLSEPYLNLKQELDTQDSNIEKLALQMKDLNKSCPVKIVPSKSFCEEAPKHLKIKPEEFDCKKYEDRHFLGNKFGIIGKEESWTATTLSGRSELLHLAIHEVIQNSLGYKDYRISDLLKVISENTVGSYEITPILFDEKSNEFFYFETEYSENSTVDKKEKAICEVLPSEILKVVTESNIDIDSLKTNFKFSFLVPEIRDLNKGSTYKTISGVIPFSSLSDCKKNIEDLRALVNKGNQIIFIQQIHEEKWEIHFLQKENESSAESKFKLS